MCCCRRKNHILYEKGKERIDEEMNVIYILNSLQKIKATMAVMVKEMAQSMSDKEYLIEKAKKLYIQRNTLCSHEDHIESIDTDYLFLEFLQQNQNDIIEERDDPINYKKTRTKRSGSLPE